jgi:hypothetical protein
LFSFPPERANGRGAEYPGLVLDGALIPLRNKGPDRVRKDRPTVPESG